MKSIFCCLFLLLTLYSNGQFKVEKVDRASSDLPEDSPSLSPDGKRLIFLRSVTTEWPQLVYRQAFALDLSSPGQMPVALGIDSVYTASFGLDGESLFLSQRLVNEAGDRGGFYLARPMPQGWQKEDLKGRDGFSASYVSQVSGGSIYFFSADGAEGPGIYRAQWNGTHFEKPIWQGAQLSPAGTTAFGPYVCPDESAMLLTVYYEADGETGRTGIYRAERRADGWKVEQIPGMPYGWSFSLSPDGDTLYFTDGEDIYRLQAPSGDLPFACPKK